MKKVIFYIKDPNGGTGRFIETLSSYLQKHHYSVIVFTHKKADEAFCINEKVIGFSLEKVRKLWNIRHLILSFVNMRIASMAIIKEKPDIVFSLDVFANLAVIPARFILKKTLFISSTHINLKKHIKEERNIIMSFLLNVLIKASINYADKHYVPSKELAGQLIGTFQLSKKKVVIIPYPVECRKILSLSRQKPPINYPKKKVILTISRLTRQKQLFLLMRSFVILRKKVNNIVLVILGDGEEKSAIVKWIRRHGLEKDISLPGWVSNPYPFIRKANLFVLLSRYEAFPYSLLEAITLGTPCLSSDVDFGPREIIQSSKQGLITSSNKPKHIAHLIKKIINMHTSRDSSYHYDIRKLGKRYLRMFEGF